MPKKLLIFSVNIVMYYFPQFVVLQGNCHVRENNIDINNLEIRDGMQLFFSNVQKKLYCNLVLYVIGRCDASFSFVATTSICQSICFHLGMRTMHQGIGSIHCRNILLF